MKLTPELLKDILKQHPINWTEEETKEVLPLLGLTAKEYYHHAAGGARSTRRFEVHCRRTYLVRVHINTSRCVSFNNEYINWGESLSGVSFGGVDTVLNLLQLTITMANKVDHSYDGNISFNPEESEYTENEFGELVYILNDLLFTNA